jgi:hypothetical protein
MGFQTILHLAEVGHIQSLGDPEMVGVLLRQYPPELVSVEALDSVIADILQPNFNHFPIGAWLALNLGCTAVKAFYSRLTPSPAFCRSPFWAFWSVLTLFHLGREVWQLIIIFLIRCSMAQLLATVDLVGRILSRPCDDVKLAVITTFAQMLLDSDLSEEYAYLFFDFLREYLFCHSRSLLQSVWDDRSPWETAEPSISLESARMTSRPQMLISLDIFRQKPCLKVSRSEFHRAKRIPKWSSTSLFSAGGSFLKSPRIVPVTPLRSTAFWATLRSHIRYVHLQSVSTLMESGGIRKSGPSGCESS